MSLFVKICGVRTIEDVAAAVAAGADAVGIVMTPSVRQVDRPTAAMLKDSVPDGVLTVGVFHHPTTDQILKAQDEVGFDLIQGETQNLRGIAGLGAIPVVHDQEDLSRAVEEAFEIATAGRVLVEGQGRGGRGSKADWGRVRDLSQIGDVILAGGLTPENVTLAIAAIGPGGVDVSSGVESSSGVKDSILISRFVEAARNADKKVAI